MVMGVAVGIPAADAFFEGDSGLVSVWDFDYDLIIDFNTQLRWAQCLLIPPMWSSSICCYPCFLKKNVEWKTRAQHVALSVDGIRFVQDKHPTCWGLHCCDRGRESKTVPYDKITDCDVQEPAGTACCCCIPNVMSRVHIDTASSGQKTDAGIRHELELHGLKRANDFKQAVWSMKRGEAPAGASVPLGAATTHNTQMVQAAPGQQAMNTVLLTEIRDELRTLNTHFHTKS